MSDLYRFLILVMIFSPIWGGILVVGLRELILAWRCNVDEE